MSSSPEAPPPADNEAPEQTESEPLLGGPGDATQKPDAPIFSNLYLGTGWLAQTGGILLLAIIWASVFTNPTLPLVSPHPLLQSLGVYTVLQAILILQPTTTPRTKQAGQRAHVFLHLLSFLLFLTGTTIIELNKHVNHLAHFHSPHAYLGSLSVLFLALQYLFGLATWLTPLSRFIFRTEARAKSLWRYHRASGYVALVLLLATVATAVETDYVRGVLGIRLWAVLVAEGLIVVGVVPRVHLRKFRVGGGVGVGVTAVGGSQS
ncbi:eukaryotic cytochrome b561-domain-containing protein [Dichotomopilus funicola]|uniref:Eukaryotic cytochrome b561-domain-containing protein n=1 Tax=Dichotomopilus funicola TaxID=1934379 RepID=A0AAN6V181_9PEZI|nr:eukaryotic cytochrome b561-domain-containing protein [Dichotomopilus funicola]